MTESVEQIAEEIRVGMQSEGNGYVNLIDVVHPWVAEEYDALHDPPAPEVDGICSREMWREGAIAEMDVMTKFMPDFKMDATSVVASGTEVVVELTISGTMADGRRMETPIRQTYLVNGGKITGCVTRSLSPDPVASLGSDVVDAFNETEAFKKAAAMRQGPDSAT